MRGGHAGEALAVADRFGQILPLELEEAGLVVEKLDLRGAAGLEQVDDPLRFGREVGQAGEPLLAGVFGF